MERMNVFAKQEHCLECMEILKRSDIEPGSRAHGSQQFTSGLPVIQELCCVRVLDPIPTKPSCVVSFLDDSGLLTSARIDELRFVNLSSQATIRCASAASGPYSCAG
jgi:hypothetical protein